MRWSWRHPSRGHRPKDGHCRDHQVGECMDHTRVVGSCFYPMTFLFCICYILSWVSVSNKMNSMYVCIREGVCLHWNALVSMSPVEAWKRGTIQIRGSGCYEIRLLRAFALCHHLWEIHTSSRLLISRQFCAGHGINAVLTPHACVIYKLCPIPPISLKMQHL